MQSKPDHIFDERNASSLLSTTHGVRESFVAHAGWRDLSDLGFGRRFRWLSRAAGRGTVIAWAGLFPSPRRFGGGKPGNRISRGLLFGCSPVQR